MASHPYRSRVRDRRGANMIEFALLMPVLTMMLGGMIDYGWYFWREALVTNALREGVRAGSIKQPDLTTEGPGECADCISVAETTATNALSSAKPAFTGFTIDAELVRTPTSGTPCTYALVVEPEINHTRLFTMVPGPTKFKVRVVSMAQNLSCS